MDFKVTKNGELVKVYGSDNEKEVIIPNNVKLIRKHAFSEFKHVEKVIIPSSVREISSEAFIKTNLNEIELPSSIEIIGESAFSYCENLKTVEFKGDIGKIEKNLFYNCFSLETVKMPNSSRSIEENAFYNCRSLKNITIPNDVTSIGEEAFSGCRSLKEIYLPDSIKEIGASAFSWCHNLNKVTLPDSLTYIPSSCFFSDSSLKSIKLPSSLEFIEELSFCNSGIESIDLPNTLKSIGRNAFGKCKLKEIVVPELINIIESGLFEFCNSLEHITFLGQITEIGEGAFRYCASLEGINIPNTVEKIEKGAFYSCKNLRKIQLPKSLKYLGEETFEFCENLEKVDFNDCPLLGIERATFYFCKSLESLILPNQIRSIDASAFCGSSLRKFEIPQSVSYIGSHAFSSCKNLKSLVIPKSVKYIYKNDFSDFDEIRIEDFSLLHHDLFGELINAFICYFNQETGEVLLTKEDKIIESYKKVQYGMWYGWYPSSVKCVLYMIFNNEELKKISNMSDILCEFIKNNVNSSNYKDIKTNLLNNKEYNKIINKLNVKDMENLREVETLKYDLFRLCYSLGVFDNDFINRQKSSNFIINALDKGYLKLSNMHASFESLKFRPYNKEWADFFMDKQNFFQLTKIENEQCGFISRVCNSFEEIKEFGRSNRGSQNYRKVTIDMCRECLSKANFEGVNNHNVDISEEIAKYTHLQPSFDEASEIREEYLSKKNESMIDDHILGESLFSKIEEFTKKALLDIKDTVYNLNELASSEFSYEFLSKYDPKNFVLGKYCSCCSHLEGAGKGIMKASIIHPDCQNLIIRDKDGRIIAKSTLYVNRKKGYGVFNNIEINQSITSSDTKYLIYLKYKEAIEQFVHKYNEKNKINPIRQINVGMNLNDLNNQIVENDIESKEILESLNFSKYGGTWNGDWKDNQYILWCDKDKIR